MQEVRRDVIQAIKFGLTMSREVVESPYRELVQPQIRYLEVTAERDPSTVTIVLLWRTA